MEGFGDGQRGGVGAPALRGAGAALRGRPGGRLQAAVCQGGGASAEAHVISKRKITPKLYSMTLDLYTYVIVYI